MDFVHYLILIIGGLFGGFMNVLIGGGGLVVLPVYMSAGLPMSIANGTNRVNLFMLYIIAIYKFSKRGKMPWRLAFKIAIPIVMGSVAGALLATNISDNILHFVLLGIIVFSFFSVWFGLKVKTNPHCDINAPVKIDWLSWILILCVGFYIGFIAVGAGMLLLSIFSLRLKMDYVKIIAVKVLVGLLVSSVGLIIFSIAGKINIIDGLVLGVGASVGAWISSGMAMKLSKKVIRNIMLVILVLAAAYMLLFKIFHVIH